MLSARSAVVPVHSVHSGPRPIESTIENRTTSVTTHFKKLTTGNDVFIVSVII